MNIKRFSPAVTFFILLAVSLLVSTKVEAGASNKSGNPFGNGSFFPDSGTFSAILRSSNGFLGAVQFSTSATTNNPSSLSTNSGVATVYAAGQQFIGTAFGTISGSTIAATYNGVYAYSVFVPTANFNTNGQLINTTYSTIGITNTVNGQFSASLFNTYPTQSFSGDGKTDVLISTLSGTNFTLTAHEVVYQTTVTGSRLVQ